MIYFKFIFVSDLVGITSYADICCMKNQTPSSAVTAGMPVTASVSAVSAPKKVRKVSVAKFVKRLDVCPMTAKGFNKRAKTMAKVISFIITRHFQYAVDGNRVTAKDASDFVQDGMLSILNGSQVDMADFTYNGEPMTQGKFFSLWLKASFQQCQRNDQFGRVTRKCKVTGKRITAHKIAVGSIATTDNEGAISISNEVEIKALGRQVSDTTYAPLKKVERKMIAFFNEATTKADKRFWANGLKMLHIECSKLPAKEACKLHGFEPSAYYVMKKRMLADDRMQVFSRLRELGQI